LGEFARIGDFDPFSRLQLSGVCLQEGQIRHRVPFMSPNSPFLLEYCVNAGLTGGMLGHMFRSNSRQVVGLFRSVRRELDHKA
jgi:hypothetical protein